MAHAITQQEFFEPLRASELDVQEALAILAQQEAKSEHSERRGNRRYFFHSPVPMEIELQQPGGSIGRFRVVPHNISNSGLGFLHGAFVHPGTRCRATLIATDGEPVAALGVTMHAKCLRGLVHFIGVK
ncbi:MAG: hypothetical protein ACYSUI_12470, partial [Planctomycetota bacterium]